MPDKAMAIACVLAALCAACGAAIAQFQAVTARMTVERDYADGSQAQQRIRAWLARHVADRPNMRGQPERVSAVRMRLDVAVDPGTMRIDQAPDAPVPTRAANGDRLVIATCSAGVQQRWEFSGTGSGWTQRGYSMKAMTCPPP